MSNFPDFIEEALKRVHPDWEGILRKGLMVLERQTPGYLEQLAKDTFLPTKGRMFAAFSQAPKAVRYVLVGEGPYPREESASGYCFMDEAVKEIWSENGLSKPVNRATSLRNFIKMLLVADGKITEESTGGDSMKVVAKQIFATDSGYIRTLDEMRQNMLGKGFLLLNATLVYRAHVPAARETKAWQPFLHTVLGSLAEYSLNAIPKPVLILWGKMAEKLVSFPFSGLFECAISEHPYNISFIRNKTMQALFQPMGLLYRQNRETK